MKLIPLALCSAARAAWRDSFPLGGREVARWFPGHMAKGEVRAGGDRRGQERAGGRGVPGAWQLSGHLRARRGCGSRDDAG